jgi:PAS domain S-box-containing protein/diguanylate cyclase (GGDEF)-like protein
MRFGRPRRDADGAWVLPLAVPVPGADGAWVAGQYRMDALQALVERMQLGGGGPTLITVVDSRRYVLARTMEPESGVGTRIEDPELAERIASGVAAVVDQHVYRSDRIRRIRAYQASAYFPLQVYTALPARHVLAPWYLLAALGASGYGLYWAGFLHLLRIVRRSDARQARLIERIRRSGELLSLALRAGKMGAWAMRSDRELWWSDEVAPLHGIDAGAADAHEAGLLARVHPDDRQKVLDKLTEMRESGQELALDYRVYAADGSLRYLSTRGAPTNVPGSGVVTSGVVVDVTEQVEAERRLRTAERQFRLMFERNPLPFWVFDVDTLRFLEVNQAAIASYGYSRDEFLSMTLRDIRPPGESPRLLADIAQHAVEDRPRVWIHRRKDGTELEARVHAAAIEFSGHRARLVLAEDVSERRRAERELDFRANHDLLTGLPNESAFLQRLQELVAAGGDGPIHVVRVVLQRHALIGDSLGAAVADEVLVQAAARLRTLVAAPGAVARMQGAEFVVATPGLAGSNGDALLESLRGSLRVPVWAGDATHHLDAAFGLAVYPRDGSSAEALVRNAGLAAHDATRQPATDSVRYSEGLAGRMSARLAMLARVQQAIEQGEFELHFQPIFNLASGEVCCYEALARWPQADGSQVPPAEFIPLCEGSALIVPFGRWVLHEAARAWLSFAKAGRPPCPIAVNVSVTQFTRTDLVAERRDLLDVHVLPAGAIELEITEGVVMGDPEQVIRTLSELRAMGARLAIDDFGTGYSNLSYLRRLPVHTLKIDRVFVHAVDTDLQNAAICRSIVSLAELFGMQVTAEGIESRAELDWFRDNGGHMAQGFLLGRPLPLSVLLAPGT